MTVDMLAALWSDKMLQHDMIVTIWTLRLAVILLFASIAVPAIALLRRHLLRSRGRFSLKVMLVAVAGAAIYLTVCVQLWHLLPDVD